MHNGGDIAFLDNPDKFSKANTILPVFATNSGYIEGIDADICGSIARYLGAGRMKIGDQVQVGEVIAYVHTNDATKAEGAVKNLADAFAYSKKPVVAKSRVLEMYGI